LSSGISVQSQNQSQPNSPSGGNTQIHMEGVENTLRLSEFQGIQSKDLEQHFFFL
jgi:hypothetical protein